MYNYLKKNKKLSGHIIDLKDYSLSNNNISDEYGSLLKRISKRKIFELISQYPDYQYNKLTKAVKDFFNINNVVLGSGSEDLTIRINLILKNSNGFAILYPNFYRIAETTGKHKKIYTTYKLTSTVLDIEPLRKQIFKNNIKTIWISNPNPIIGKVYEKRHLVEIIKKNKKILFILDESAIDFMDNINNYSVIDLSQKVNNLVVIRSFSKLYSLAGLRAGFATGRTKILENIKRIGPTFPINNFADYFIRKILKKKNIISGIKKRIQEHKRLIKKILSQNPNIIFSDSDTNCLFFGCSDMDIFSELLKFGIISLKLDEQPGVREKNFVRITIHSSKVLHKNLSIQLSRFINKYKKC